MTDINAALSCFAGREHFIEVTRRAKTGRDKALDAHEFAQRWASARFADFAGVASSVIRGCVSIGWLHAEYAALADL